VRKRNEIITSDGVICGVCPHYCLLKEGEVGLCSVRQNHQQHIYLAYYGECSIIAIEPIEKRPFYHFIPGSEFLSVGFRGCNFSCDFCENHKISQSMDSSSQHYLPSDLVSLARQKKTKGIVFTYNEPVIYHEYIADLGHHLIRNETDLYLAIKTNGFVDRLVLRDLMTYVDAFNVDVKGDDHIYRKSCNGRFDVVRDTIEMIYAANVHLEISYLVVKESVDNLSYHKEMSRWISSLSPDIPIHLLYCFPCHKTIGQFYDPHVLTSIVDIFSERMNYVYISNLSHADMLQYRNTRCTKCGSILINRSDGVKIRRLSCCGKKVPGMW